MQLYNTISIIVVLTAAFAYINFKFIKLPITISIMLISLISSLLIIAVGKWYPSVFTYVKVHVDSIDFSTLLMKVMLGFLLFAGAIHIDVQKMRKAAVPIFVFSTASVLLSTFII